MAKKTQRPADPTVPVAADDEPTVTVYPAIPNPLDEVLSAYNLPANTLHVEVLRSHDQVYEGQLIVLPNDDRTAGLINGGFVQVVPPPVLGVDAS